MSTRPDVVVNCIGIVKQVVAAHAADEVWATNAALPHRLAERCERAAVRLIHISTDCVFSGTSGPYDEDEPPDPVDLYGQAKLAGEIGGPHLTLRTSFIGPQLGRADGLFEWLRSNASGTVPGFVNVRFSGMTTFALGARPRCRHRGATTAGRPLSRRFDDHQQGRPAPRPRPALGPRDHDRPSRRATVRPVLALRPIPRGNGHCRARVDVPARRARLGDNELMRFHFSVDDVFDAVLDQPRILTDVHDATGASVDLYVFLRRRRDDRVDVLDEMTSVDANLLRGQPWLRLAPHALDVDTPPHRQSPEELRHTLRRLYDEIERRGAAVHVVDPVPPLLGALRLRRGPRGQRSHDAAAHRQARWQLPTVRRRPRHAARPRGRPPRRAGAPTLALPARVGSRARGSSWAAFARELDQILVRHNYLAFFTHEGELYREPVRAALWRCLEYVQQRDLTCV